MHNIPGGFPADPANIAIPTAVPVDASGNAVIPELAGRQPTHNESVLLAGTVITAASSNVEEFWYMWQERRLFVKFLDGSLYVYEGVPLSKAVEFIETDSPGRFVWNKLRDVYPYRKLSGGKGPRKRPQVVRTING